MPALSASTQLRVCHVVASINTGTGGPAISVPRLVEGLVAGGMVIRLVALDYPEHGAATIVRGATVELQPVDVFARHGRGWSPSLDRRLQAAAANSDVIHNHGLWMFPNRAARRAAAGAGIPLVISPRGMLEPWARQRGRFKKALVWWAWERANLYHAALLHATSPAEAGALRSMGLRTPVAMIPNGVDVPDLTAPPARAVLEGRFPELVGKRWLLFMSRLHAKKGISELLQAWRTLAARSPDWQLLIAGPDLDGYGALAQAQAESLGLRERITWCGMLAGTEKACALARSELFVLPSHSENFGIAVAEALAYGLPVVTTRGTPWSELVSRGCGWWIELTPETLAATLGSAIRKSPAELQAMGACGREWMREKYSWAGVAVQMQATYRWLVKHGPRPDCVQIPGAVAA